MNPYVKNLKRLEFVITYACTGRCKHCSEGDHDARGPYLDGAAGAAVVTKVAEKYKLDSMMTFGGEPLLHPEVTCQMQEAARRAGIPKRQLITNGFFSKDRERIRQVAEMIAESGVNDVLLSVDAFHQEAIPLEPVKWFAEELLAAKVPVRISPAWLVSETDDNEYNRKTAALLQVFTAMGISVGKGNVIFPSGNALKYLKEYFDLDNMPVSPYWEDPGDVHAICVDPNGDVLQGNIFKTDILNILAEYKPGD